MALHETYSAAINSARWQDGKTIQLSSSEAGWDKCLHSFLSPAQTYITHFHWVALKHQRITGSLQTHTHTRALLHTGLNLLAHHSDTSNPFLYLHEGAAKTQVQPDSGRRIVKNKNHITPQSWNYAWRCGARSSCCGALPDGKLWVRAGGPATFIDFQVHRLQVARRPNLDSFHSGIVRLESSDFSPVFVGYAWSRASWSDKEMAFVFFVVDNGEWMKRTFQGINWQHNDR